MGDGCLQFLLHSDDGAILARNKLQCEQARSILASPLFATTRNMLQAVVEGEAENSQESLRTGEQVEWPAVSKRPLGRAAIFSKAGTQKRSSCPYAV